MDFCDDCTFFTHYEIERVKESNHVRDCVISVRSNWDVICKDKIIRVLGIVDDLKLMILDRHVEIKSLEKNLRVVLLQLLILEK